MSSTERAVREHAVDDAIEDDGVGERAPDDDSGAITAPDLPGQPRLKSRRAPAAEEPPVPSSNGRSHRTETVEAADPGSPDADARATDDAPAPAVVPEPPLVAPVATSARLHTRTASALADPPTQPTIEAPAAPADVPGGRTPTETRPLPETPAEPAVEPGGIDLDAYAGDDGEPVQAPVVRRTLVDAERHLIAPVTRPVGRRPRARRVTRVLRHVDPWSVFKVAAVFSMVIYGVVLTAGVLLWNVAHSTGTIDNVEQFFESFGWSEFEFEGGEIYHSAWIAGLFIAVAMTGFAVLAATLFNLITDLVGGVRMTVLEEEVIERTDSPMRRFTVRRNQVGDRSGPLTRPAAPVEDQPAER